jgi:Mrp family chromosome partitioning ATPase
MAVLAIDNLLYIVIAGTVIVFLIALFLVFQKTPSGKTSGKPKQKVNSSDHGGIAAAAADYPLIADRILKLPGKNKSIIFAAPNISSLPTTIPVNIAIQLAKNKTRCLLIDLDVKRNAVAKAFDIQSSPAPATSRPTAHQTPFKLLYIWPAHNFTQMKQMNIVALVTAALKKFDYVLINAPYIADSPDRKHIVAAAQYCLLFSHDTTQAEPILELIKQTKCKLIANIQVPDIEQN